MGWRRQLQTWQPSQPIADVASQLADPVANVLPTQGRLKINRSWNCQPWTRVARAFKFICPKSRGRTELVAVIGPAAVVMPAPAHLERLQAFFRPWAKPEKPRARRSQEPFVAVGTIIITV